jgi:hypothetical protein
MSGAYARPLHPGLSERSSGYRHEDRRQPSPPRPIPSYTDADEGLHHRDPYSMHGLKASERGDPRAAARMPIDTRRGYSPTHQYLTPTSGHHVSPHSTSPYGNGRDWGGQHGSYHGQPP